MRRIKSVKGLLWMFILPTILFTSCYTYDDELWDAERQLVSTTKFDPARNFSDFHNYVISDSIIYFSVDDHGNIVKNYLDNPYTKRIVDQVRNSLESLNYTEVTDTAQADLAIALSFYNITNYYADFYPAYYYWYWGWDWDWYYPPYYYSVITSYTVGSLIIDMGAIHQKNAKGQIPVVWSGAIRGIETGDHSDSEVREAIDDCFNFDGSPLKR